ncbi:MAG: membrane protein insertase YidC [Acidobacteriota bacterium]|nr:membrane protein insertase YidC [Acidobacteriota bacterium]
MDRDTTLRMLAAVALSIGVYVVWFQLFVAPNRQLEDDRARPPAEGPVDPRGWAADETLPSESLPTESLPGDEPAAAAADAIEGQAGQPPFDVVTPKLELKLSARGGRIVNARLADFELVPGDKESGLVDLVSPEARRLDRHPLTILHPDPELERRINEAWFAVEREAPDPARLAELGLPEATEQIVFRWSDGAGLEAEKTLLVPQDESYLMHVDWALRRFGAPVTEARLSFGPSLKRESEDQNKNRYSYRGFAVVAGPYGVDRYAPDKIDVPLRHGPEDAPRWAALDSQYFAVALIAEGKTPVDVLPVDVTSPDGEPTRELALAAAEGPLFLFCGPKSVRLLREIDDSRGLDLSQLVDWGFFGVLARPLHIALAYIHDVVGNWGVAIVLLTFVIKVLFFPLTQRAMVNMRKTQERMGKLQPKMRKIKEKYRDKKDMESRRKMQEDMMGLYKAEGVNPMAPIAGCLPLLLQLPVLYGMYTLLTVVIDLRGAPFFGWIRDMSSADPYLITPLVMGVTMLGQQLLSLAKVEDPQQKAQQRMMLLMPVMFTYFFIWLPSGLVLYWLTNNVLGIAQQLLINRQAAAEKAS